MVIKYPTGRLPKKAKVQKQEFELHWWCKIRQCSFSKGHYKSGTSQARQIITIIENLPSCIGNKGYLIWKGNPHHGKELQDDFMPATVGRRAYGTIIASVFTWNRNAIDTENEYTRAMKIRERSTAAGIRQ